MDGRKLLLRTLALNAAFSGLSAVLLVVAAGWVAAQLGLAGAGAVYAVAVLLLLFALQLGNIVRTREIRRWEIAGIIAGDLGWVLGSGILVTLFHASLTRAGVLLVDAVALVVLYFAVQQIRGLLRLDATAA